MPNKLSFGEKNYKYFIGYLCNSNNVRSLHIMLPKTVRSLLHILPPKTSAYVKCNDGQTKWMNLMDG